MKTFPALLLSTLLFVACSNEKYLAKVTTTTLPSTALSQEQIQKDVEFYIRTAENSVPFLYQRSSKAYVDSIATVIKQHEQLSPLAFYENFLRLQGAFDINHFYSRFPRDLFRKELREKEEGLFPYLCRLNDTLLTTEKSYLPAAERKVGYTLMSINGLDADSLFSSYYQYSGGSVPSKHQDVHYNFPTYLWLNDIRAPFTLQMRDSTGQSFSHETAGYIFPEKREQSNQAPTETFDDIVQYQLLENGTAYIKVSQLWGFSADEMKQFLASTFADIKDQGAENLIVDLRGNPGGNDRLGLLLLDYFAQKPYRLYGSQYRKISKEYNRFFRKGSSMSWLIRQIPYGGGIKLLFHKYPEEAKVYTNVKPGTTPKLIEIEENPLRFTGNTYLVADNGTYSSAVSITNAVEDFDLATLIGEYTGGIPNELAEVMYMKLPNSGISFVLATTYYVRANGDKDNPNPCQPDIYIPQAELDRMSAEDLAAFIQGLK